MRAIRGPRFGVVLVAALLAALMAATPARADFWESLPEAVRLGSLSLDLYGTPLRLRQVEIDRRPGAPIALAIGRIEGPAEMIPLWASLRLAEAGDGWRVNGVLASGAGELVVRIEGSGLGGQSPRLALRGEPLRFAADGLRPERLWAGLGAHLREVEGTLAFFLDWRQGRGDSATLSLEDLRLVTDYGVLGPINGTVSLDRLLPPRTAEPQHLRVEGIGLARLAESLEIEALSADGTLDADLVFSFDGTGRPHVDEGRLKARGPGRLRYRPEQPPAALAGQGGGVDIMLQALTDFRYETLEAIVSGYLDDEMSVVLKLRGANPELYEGYPIELNLNLEAPIVPLIGAGRDALRLPEAARRILERLDG